MLRAKRGASIRGEACIRAAGSRAACPAGADRRQLDGDPHELLGIGGDQFRQAEIHQLAQARSPHDRWPHQGHDRHAHPKRVQAGRVPVVGNGIQSDVDAVVILQVLLPGLAGRRTSRDRGATPSSRQQVQRLLAMRPFAGQDRQPRAIDGLEHPRPELEDAAG